MQQPNCHLTCFRIAVCTICTHYRRTMPSTLQLLLISTCEKCGLKVISSQANHLNSAVPVWFQIWVLSNDACAQFILTRLHFDTLRCARGVGNTAVLYSDPVDAMKQEEVSYHGTKFPPNFPAVGNVPHPQIRSTDTPECSGCRKTRGEASRDANL